MSWPPVCLRRIYYRSFDLIKKIQIWPWPRFEGHMWPWPSYETEGGNNDLCYKERLKQTKYDIKILYKMHYYIVLIVIDIWVVFTEVDFHSVFILFNKFYYTLYSAVYWIIGIKRHEIPVNNWLSFIRYITKYHYIKNIYLHDVW